MAPKVGIVMGSDSDLPVLEKCAQTLKEFGVEYEITVMSAHRTPERATQYARTARTRGLRVIIAGAGMAAHLAGALAAQCVLPIIGVPLDASPLKGMDALLATVQMPPGIPVATVAIGAPGAKNAALLAVQILATSDDDLYKKLENHRLNLEQEVLKKAKAVEGI